MSDKPAQATPQFVATSIASYLRPVALALDARGVSSVELFRELGIDAGTPSPLKRIKSETIGRVYAAAVRVTGDPLFGLDVARFMRPSHLHALGYSALASITLREFCQRMSRYFAFWTTATKVEPVVGPPDEYLRFYDIDRRASFESEDALIGFLVRLMGELCDGRFAPQRVAMRRPLPGDGGAAHRAAWGCPVEFGHSEVAIHFAPGDLDRALSAANRELAGASDRVVESYLARLDLDDLETRVARLMHEQLQVGPVSRTAIARALNISPRTLQSMLVRSGLSYRVLLDRERSERAITLLEDPAMSIKQVAFAVGFSSPSNFARAFRRWTGQAPSAFRMRQDL